MKQRTKNILISSVVVISITSLIIWYLFPVLITKWSIHGLNLNKPFEVVPSYIERLPDPPADWDDISMGALTLRLPISTYKIISGKDTYINFISDRGTLLIFNLDSSERHVSYEERLAIFKVLPGDISFFNSRNKNEKNSASLVLKAISLPRGGEVTYIKSEEFKAICTISEKDEKGFSAIAALYGPNETMTFSIMLTQYKDKTALKSDLLSIVGGVRIPEQPPKAETLRNDINLIVKKYNKTG